MYKTGQTGCCSSLLAGILSECIVFPVLNAFQNGQSVVQFLKRNKCNSHSTCSQTISHTHAVSAQHCAHQEHYKMAGEDLVLTWEGYVPFIMATQSTVLLHLVVH